MIKVPKSSSFIYVSFLAIAEPNPDATSSSPSAPALIVYSANALPVLLLNLLANALAAASSRAVPFPKPIILLNLPKPPNNASLPASTAPLIKPYALAWASVAPL